MSFRFNFGGDEDSGGEDPDAAPQTAVPAVPVQTPPKSHTLEELISALPQNISYSTLGVTSAVQIPRRELYDVRMQLMAEDKLDISIDGRDKPEKSTLVGLGDEDIRTSFYEGGLKSWECSVDLVRHLIGEGDALAGVQRILELGCGTSLPTLHLFQSTLRTNAQTHTHFTLADYNVDVLRLVTLPNLLLSWARSRAPSWDPEGDLDVTDALKAEFTADLAQRGITVDFVSGGWGEKMLGLLKTRYGLVLASETIYSPGTTGLFTDVLMGAMEDGGRGLVAAKQIYFGVGGSVADFVGGVERRVGVWKGVREEREVGVGRSVVEVRRMRKRKA